MNFSMMGLPGAWNGFHTTLPVKQSPVLNLVCLEAQRPNCAGLLLVIPEQFTARFVDEMQVSASRAGNRLVRMSLRGRIGGEGHRDIHAGTRTSEEHTRHNKNLQTALGSIFDLGQV